MGRYGRAIIVGAVGAQLVLAGTVRAGVARADTNAYLNDLHRAGIHDLDGGDPALLQVGPKLCQQVSHGATTDQLESLALQRSDARLGARGLKPSRPTTSSATP